MQFKGKGSRRAPGFWAGIIICMAMESPPPGEQNFTPVRSFIVQFEFDSQDLENLLDDEEAFYELCCYAEEWGLKVEYDFNYDDDDSECETQLFFSVDDGSGTVSEQNVYETSSLAVLDWLESYGLAGLTPGYVGYEVWASGEKQKDNIGVTEEVKKFWERFKVLRDVEYPKDIF